MPREDGLARRRHIATRRAPRQCRKMSGGSSPGNSIARTYPSHSGNQIASTGASALLLNKGCPLRGQIGGKYGILSCYTACIIASPFGV